MILNHLLRCHNTYDCRSVVMPSWHHYCFHLNSKCWQWVFFHKQAFRGMSSVNTCCEIIKCYGNFEFLVGKGNPHKWLIKCLYCYLNNRSVLFLCEASLYSNVLWEAGGLFKCVQVADLNTKHDWGCLYVCTVHMCMQPCRERAMEIVGGRECLLSPLIKDV